MEHLRRRIYQPGHNMSDENGFRIDIIEAVKKWRYYLFVFLEGNLFQSIIVKMIMGQKERCLVRLDLAWHSIETSQL